MAPPLGSMPVFYEAGILFDDTWRMWPVTTRGGLGWEIVCQGYQPPGYLPSSKIFLDDKHSPFLFPTLFQLCDVTFVFPPFPVSTNNNLRFTQLVPALSGSPAPKYFLYQCGQLFNPIPSPFFQLLHNIYRSEEDSSPAKCILFCTNR